MSVVEANVAIMNGLYQNWSISNPGKDTVGWTDPAGNLHLLDSKDPTKIHFTTRLYAYAPTRIHAFQISVRRQPERYIPVQFGQVTKYLNDKGILIDVWVLTGPQQSIETAEVNWYNMAQEVKRIIRVFGTQFGSNIQAVMLNRLEHDDAALELTPPHLHGTFICTAKLYEVVTS